MIQCAFESPLYGGSNAPSTNVIRHFFMILHIGEYKVLFVPYVTLHRVQTARNFWAHELYEIFCVLFLLIFCYWCVGQSSFFYWHTDVGQVDLADTLNMFVKNSENFLETFEKKRFQLKKWSFVKIFQPHFELHFSKSQLFSLFLPYNPFGVSCGYDFFTDAIN